MGAWGHGNLECDGAQDILGDLSDELFERVTTLLKTPAAAEHDELEHDELFVRIEMIFALAARGMINSSPTPGEIRPLIDQFFDNCLRYYKSAKQELPQERKRIMEESFSNLLVVAEHAQNGSFEHRLNLISDVMGKNNKS